MSKIFNTLLGTLLVMTSLSQMTSSATPYIAEVRVFVDQSGFSRWTELTGKTQKSDLMQEITSIFYEMNQFYRRLQSYDLDIQLRIKDMTIMDEDIFNVKNGKIISNTAAEVFKNWVNPLYQSENSHDVAVLFTGANLIRQDLQDTTFGFAYISAVCSNMAVGVIELHGIYDDVFFSTHELGHILGASHDGVDGGANCANNSGEISNAFMLFAHPKHYYFSSCAANSIKNKIKELTKNNNNCLTQTGNSKEIAGPRFATLLTMDDLCKRAYGHRSYVSRQRYSSYGDDICVRVTCVIWSEENKLMWQIASTPEGINCGMNKICVKGKCVPSDLGSPAVSDTCPFGDQPKIERAGRPTMTCSQMDAAKCVQWENACCQTCKSLSWQPASDPGTADDVCRQREGANSAMARTAYADYGDNLCSHLACITSKPGLPWSYARAPSGMKCGKDKRCQDGKCVFSIHNDVNMSDSCPYGDQPSTTGFLQNGCAAGVRQFGCHSAGIKETCCGSCKDPGTADEICRTLAGPHSGLAHLYYNSYGDDLCTRLACITKEVGFQTFWVYFTAPDGMKCGKSKRCSKGKCLWSPLGDPTMSDSCPYGDQLWFAGGYQATCQQIIKKNGCRGWETRCCDSCKKTQTTLV